MPSALTRRHVLASAAATAAVAAMPAAHAIAAVEGAPVADRIRVAWYQWSSAPPAPGDPTFTDLLKAANAEILRAMRHDDVIVFTNGVDQAQGEVPRKFDGLAYIRDVAARRK